MLFSGPPPGYGTAESDSYLCKAARSLRTGTATPVPNRMPDNICCSMLIHLIACLISYATRYHAATRCSAAYDMVCASEQVYRQADAGRKLKKSASLAILRSHRTAIEALLADVKYDKIAHVRQVSIQGASDWTNPLPGG